MSGAILRAFESMAGARLPLVLCGVLGGLLGVYRVWHEPPVYDSSAEIVLRVAGSSNLTLVYAGSVHQVPINPATEANIMLSDAVLSRVAKDLNLANDPRFAPFALPGLVWDSGQPEVRAASLALLRAGLSVSFEDTAEDVTTIQAEKSSSQLKRKQNFDTGPRILYVSYSGRDPSIGGPIVNGVIRAYEERTLELRRDSMMRVAAQLSSSLEDYRRMVETEQGALLDLERRGGVNGATEAQNPDAEELAALRAQAGFSQARLRAARAEDEAMSHGSNGQTWSSGDELTRLRIDAALAREEEAEVMSSFGPRHPALEAVRARVVALQDAIATAERRFEEQVAAQVRLADSEAKLVSAEIGKKTRLVRAQQDAWVAATALEVQLARDSELYYVLVNNVRTAELDAGYGTVSVQTLKEAEVPGRLQGRDYVHRPLGYLLAGLAIGFAIAALRMALPNARLFNADQAGLVLEMPCLAQVPLAGTAFAEAIDKLRDAILLASIDDRVRRIAFTSGAGSDDAVAVAIGVAISLARHGKRVLLIDASPDGNPGRPSVHRALGLEAPLGLSSVLSGRVQIEEAAIPMRKGCCVDVLPAGPRPPNPVEALGSDGMRLLLDQAELSYRYLVLVAPPVLSRAEAAAVLNLADFGILVARQNRWSSRRLTECGYVLQETEVRLAGFVQTVPA